MKRSGFKRTELPRVRTVHTPGTGRGVMAPSGDAVIAVPKEGALQDEAYIAAVRTLRCAHCGWPPRSQFCHRDEGKGTGIKTDCRLGWPGCGPRLGEIGCHALIGSTGKLGKDMRRALEDLYAMRTRLEIRSRGLWPTGLPAWGDE